MARRIRIGKSLLLLACLLVPCFATTNAHPKAHPPVLEHNAGFEEKLIELTNQERLKAGLLPLKRQEDLCRSARWLADDMAANNYFRHVDSLGRNIHPRLPEFGYKDYLTIGENIAGGQSTPAAVLADWLKSPGHRANLLSPNFREIGIAYVHGPNSEEQDYWVQDFGARAAVFPVVIDLGTRQTRSTHVHLTILAENWARQIRVSNDDQHWTEWTPFRPSLDWRLNLTPGKQTVYVELNNGKETRRSLATIELVTPPTGSL